MVIDVSKYNGNVDYPKVKNNCEGVIIRAGYRGYSTGKIATDVHFKRNIVGAAACNIPKGVYFVTQAITQAEGKEEAWYTLDLVKQYKLNLPIFIDAEDSNVKATGRADRGKLSKDKRTGIIKAFCDEIEKKGYIAGVYASESWFRDMLNISKLDKYYLWVAKYSSKEPGIKWDAWQYTDKGQISGITGNVDMSKFKTVKKTINEIAKEVINGKWGDGIKRKQALTAAGYNYKLVQAKVNEMLGL